MLGLGNEREAGNVQSREVECDSGDRMQLPILGAGYSIKVNVLTNYLWIFNRSTQGSWSLQESLVCGGGFFNLPSRKTASFPSLFRPLCGGQS